MAEGAAHALQPCTERHIKPGDVLEAQIDRIGTLVSPVVAEKS